MEIFLTIFAGTTIYVLGQLLSRFIFDPIQKQKEIVGKISFAITFYGNKFPSKNSEGKIVNIDELSKSSEDVRALASELRATVKSIPFYKLFSLLNLIPNTENIKKSSASLIGWSNSFYETGTMPNPRLQFRKEIAEALKIDLE